MRAVVTALEDGGEEMAREKIVSHRHIWIAILTVGREPAELIFEMFLDEGGVGEAIFVSKEFSGEGDDIPVVRLASRFVEDVTIGAIRFNFAEEKFPMLAAGFGDAIAQMFVSEHRGEGEKIAVIIGRFGVGEFLEGGVEGERRAVQEIGLASAGDERGGGPGVAGRAVLNFPLVVEIDDTAFGVLVFLEEENDAFDDLEIIFAFEVGGFDVSFRAIGFGGGDDGGERVGFGGLQSYYESGENNEMN